MKKGKLFYRPLLCLLALGFLLAMPVLAAGSVVYKGCDHGFTFGPGGEYSSTDLFPTLKQALPGDVLTETVTVENAASCCDFIKLYLRAEAHGDANPLSQEVASREDVASMEDFLSQLHMTVWNGQEKIFEAAPNKPGALQENKYLGSFRRSKSTTLTIELEVPAELDNKYANRIGEVDWIFTAEEFDDVDPNTPVTGDHSHVFLYVAIMAASLLGLLLLLLYRKKQNAE